MVLRSARASRARGAPLKSRYISCDILAGNETNFLRYSCYKYNFQIVCLHSVQSSPFAWRAPYFYGQPIIRIAAKFQYKISLLRPASRCYEHYLMVSRLSALKELCFSTKILRPEGCSWCEHFPPPHLEKLRVLLLLLLLLLSLLLLLLLLLSMMILIIGFTFPPTIHVKVITKCDSLYVNFITSTFFYYKVRQNTHMHEIFTGFLLRRELFLK